MTTDLLGIVALGALTLYLLVALVGRSLWQRSRTGDSGWRGAHGPPGSRAWWAALLMAAAVVGIIAAPVVAALGPAHPVGPARAVVGAVAFGLGFVITVAAQWQMGAAWRIGVQQGERTELCTEGAFAWSRNPIFTGMLLATLGLVPWVPTAAAAWLALWLALELQVRAVEEPHLLAMHGDRYRAYADRTGRFWPGLGRGLA